MRRALLVALAAGADGARPDGAAVFAWELTPESCEREAAQAPVTEFHTKWNSPSTQGQWPLLYLLGAQKAATTAVAITLSMCGLVAHGTNRAKSMACPEEKVPCKETLHQPLLDGLATEEGVRKYTAQFNTSNCNEAALRDACAHGRDSMFCKQAHVQRDACLQGRFLEATPLTADSVSKLMSALPAPHMARSRFVAIFREPVSRMLSWYNHVVADDALPPDAPDLTSFDAYARYAIGEKIEAPDGPVSHGRYLVMLDEFMAGGAQRNQLLVLNFNLVNENASRAMNLITRHYGLPQVITGVDALPSSNTHMSNGKVVKIDCNTRQYLNDYYSLHNLRLYERLERDRLSGEAPAIEPKFPQFYLNSVPCGKETTEGELNSLSADMVSWLGAPALLSLVPDRPHIEAAVGTRELDAMTAKRRKARLLQRASVLHSGRKKTVTRANTHRRSVLDTERDGERASPVGKRFAIP